MSALLPMRRLSAIMAFVGAIIIYACAGAAEKIPVSVPLKFGADRFVEFSVTVERHRNYYLDLVFNFENDQQRRVARKLVGEANNVCRAMNECGELSSFGVTIKSGDALILQRQTQPYGYYSHGESKFWRNILITPLRPNTYTVTIEIVDFGSDMRNANTSIELRTDPREKDLVGR